jgi:acyl-CoA dehydrogenase
MTAPRFALGAEHEAIAAEAREVAGSVADLAVEADALSTVHPAMLAALRESRLSELMVPAAYGGRFEQVDPLAVCLTREALMGVSSHLDSLFALQGIGSFAISVGGDDEQRARWLPNVAGAKTLAALALTEPEAGSDLKSLVTTITRVDGGLVLDGRKAFISNAGAAGFYTVLAREGDAFTLVLVPADTPGIEVEPTAELIAPHVLGDVAFDMVRLPDAARLGAPGQGFDLVLATLAVFRVSVAGAALGLAQAALEEALRHATGRLQFGKPLSRLGAVSEMLADSWTEIEMARLLTYRAAELARNDPAAALPQSSMAKLAATETASKVVDRGVQIMGRFGLLRDSKMERLYRQARPMRIYEGSSEVLRISISRALEDEVIGARR